MSNIIPMRKIRKSQKISMYPPFVQSILAGLKTQTITRSRGFDVGEDIYFFEGIRLYAVGRVTLIHPILLYEDEIIIDFYNLEKQILIKSKNGLKKFAQKDGFINYKQMCRHYMALGEPFPFKGFLVQWEPQKEGNSC
jgi:hypothetical protein